MQDKTNGELHSQEHNSGPKKIPTGIKIISVLFYVLFGFYALQGLFYLIFGIIVAINPTFDFNFITIFGTNLGLQLNLFLATARISPISVLTPIIFTILPSILAFFIAKGLKKGKKWAKVLILIISIVGILASILAVLGGQFISLLSLAVFVWIAGYLFFNKKAKRFFS